MRRLSKQTVHVSGTGRIGSALIVRLLEAGIGLVTCNDPQIVDEETLACWPLAHPSDMGRPKVQVLERFVHDRFPGSAVGLMAPNQSPAVEPYLERADLLVSCANRFDARMHITHSGIRMNKVVLQASLQDGREALGGSIAAWAPGARGACYNCLFPRGPGQLTPGDIFLPTVTAVTASLAAHVAVSLLGNHPARFVRRHNLFIVDLQRLSVESLLIHPRSDCEICMDSPSERVR